MIQSRAATARTTDLEPHVARCRAPARDRRDSPQRRIDTRLVRRGTRSPGLPPRSLLTRIKTWVTEATLPTTAFQLGDPDRGYGRIRFEMNLDSHTATRRIPSVPFREQHRSTAIDGGLDLLTTGTISFADSVLISDTSSPEPPDRHRIFPLRFRTERLARHRCDWHS